jgi:MoxR-like ATPase
VEDIRALAQPVLRHRILLNYRAEAEGITVEQVIEKLLETVKSPLPA